MADYSSKDLNRRRYTIESDAFDKKGAKLQIVVLLNGRKIADVQAREPGMIAFVSKPTEPGFDLEIVEASGVRYTDFSVPGQDSKQEGVAPWQLQALGIEP